MPAHVVFRARARQAETELELRLVATITKAAYDDPRWALQLLERRLPERWRGRPGVESAQDADTFSREFQCVPRDDVASMFPRQLTALALEQGADGTSCASHRPGATEAVVLGLDLAVSEAAAADYTVAIVAAYDISTRERRVLTVRRQRGLSLTDQVALVRELFVAYGIMIAVIEDNGFQRWLVDELAHHPETAGRVLGHTTGAGRSDARSGIPALKLALLGHRWTMPCGDDASRRLALAWQDELAAFGWRGGRLEGTGEHDDLVLASWFVERAVAYIDAQLAIRSDEEIVTAADVGIAGYRISPDLDAAPEPWPSGDIGSFGWEERRGQTGPDLTVPRPSVDQERGEVGDRRPVRRRERGEQRRDGLRRRLGRQLPREPSARDPPQALEELDASRHAASTQQESPSRKWRLRPLVGSLRARKPALPSRSDTGVGTVRGD
jgi:hypothetical protein